VSFGEVNGEHAILARSGDTLVGVLVPEIADGRITGFRVLANPGKLRFAEAQLSRFAELSGS
jgi:RNA polymerase sigma-70 factor (ECF subfamily)